MKFMKQQNNLENIDYEITNTLKTKGKMTVAQIAYLVKIPMNEVAVYILNNLHLFKIQTANNQNCVVELQN